MKHSRPLTAVLLALALVAMGGPAVAATEEPVDPQLTRLLDEVPGGVVIDGGSAVWPELDMEYRPAAVTPRAAARAVGSCATGRICAYNASNLGGGVLSWGSCTTISIPSSFATRSAANARTSGYMQVRNGTSVLASVNANAWSNVSGSATNIRCFL
ncbi:MULTISPECIES: hypothetical protein [unclassified Microbacterium]|uniref:hypothetical protein n=1 Tax=unclassified Microbacterium TaxID=2609290 RepID=UPI00289C23AD|nr:hypothetical protein [Microbacterium sp.]